MLPVSSDCSLRHVVVCETESEEVENSKFVIAENICVRPEIDEVPYRADCIFEIAAD